MKTTTTYFAFALALVGCSGDDPMAGGTTGDASSDASSGEEHKTTESSEEGDSGTGLPSSSSSAETTGEATPDEWAACEEIEPGPLTNSAINNFYFFAGQLLGDAQEDDFTVGIAGTDSGHLDLTATGNDDAQTCTFCISVHESVFTKGEVGFFPAAGSVMISEDSIPLIGALKFEANGVALVETVFSGGLAGFWEPAMRVPGGRCLRLKDGTYSNF